LLGVSQGLRGEATTLFLLIAGGAAVTVLARHHAAALGACQWSSAERAVRLGQSVLRIALLGALLACGLGLAAAGWSYLVACGAGAIGLAAVSRRLLPELSWARCATTRTAVAELIRPGAWMSLGAVAGVLIAGVDRAVAGRFVSLEAVTVFALTGASFLLLEAMLTSAVDAARPAIGQALGSARRGEAARVYLRLATAAAAAGPVVALALFASNGAFVTAWTGAESYGGWRLDFWFALALVVNLWSLPHRALLSADLRAREATVWRSAEGGLNLVLSIGLALRFGIVGVAAGTAIAAMCTSCWALPCLATRSAGVSALRLAGPILQGMAVSVVLAPLAWVAHHAAMSAGFLGAVLAAAAVSGAGALLWWRLALPAQMRRTWVAVARERRRAWSAAA
jgi:O-antigen/teichoic acid export membrane protein